MRFFLKKYFLLLTLLLVLPLNSSAQFTDDFSDGDFTSSPTWIGETDKFVVEGGMLRLNDQSASGSGSFKAYLSTASEASINAEWKCRIKANLTLTSSNYVRFYVIADRSDLKDAGLAGYYIQVGGTKKKVSLYRQNGSTTTEIISGTDNRFSASSNDLEVKLTRDANWNFTLWSKKSDEANFVKEGESFIDNSNTSSSFSGVYVNFSSSNKANYYFDDFVVTGEPYVYIPQDTERHSIVISEILADPDPPAGLPNFEFFEVYNRTAEAIDLANWQVSVGNSTSAIISGTIEPNSYAILCSQAAGAEFTEFGNVISMRTLPTLPNSGGTIVLRNPEGGVVTWTEYSDKWFGSETFKKDGGFSLERIDLNNLHNFSDNWKPSTSNTGGTPGQENTAKASNPDQVPPEVLYHSLLGSNAIQIRFSKEMSADGLSDVANYVSNSQISQIQPQEPKLDVVVVEFAEEFAEDTVEIEVRGLRCVSGLALESRKLRIASPDSVESLDLVINEVLYNAPDGVEEFVELYNRSPKVINLATLFITNRNSEGNLNSRKTISKDSILIFPNEYILLSSGIASICQAYSCGDGLKVETSIPSLANTEGNVVVCKTNGDIIDEFAYTDKMQSPAVINSKGVSLERVNPHKPTQDPNNWQSAAFTENYATPARQNSQYNVEPPTESEKAFWLDYETFTPDQDGYRDFLLLNYKLPEEGYSISATVYTSTGVEVKRLARNQVAALSGVLRWDGSNESGSLAEVGVYVVRVQAFKSGKKVNGTVVCVLSMR